MSKMVQVAELSICNSEDELIFENLSFNVEGGEIAQLKGLTEIQYDVLFRVLIGELDPDSGQIVVSGRNIVRLNEKKRKEMLKKEVSFVPYDFILPKEKTVREALEFKMGIIGDTIEADEMIEETLRYFQLGGVQGSLPGEMSPEEKARSVLALATVNSPRLLICRNPFSELGRGDEEEILKLLANVVDTSGLTAFLLSSTLKPDLERIQTIEV